MSPRDADIQEKGFLCHNLTMESISGGPFPTDILLVAIPETAGSALYGMLDVLAATGSIWQTLSRSGGERQYFHVRVPFHRTEVLHVWPPYSGKPRLRRGRRPYGIDCDPARALAGAGRDSGWSLLRTDRLDPAPPRPWLYDLLGLLWRDPSGGDGTAGRLPSYLAGPTRSSSRQLFPKVRFDPVPNLVYAEPQGRTVTAGGITSWHDLVLHLIARHVGPGEALRIARSTCSSGTTKASCPTPRWAPATAPW